MGSCCAARGDTTTANVPPPPDPNIVEVNVDLGEDLGTKKMKVSKVKNVQKLYDDITAEYKISDFTLELDGETLHKEISAGIQGIVADSAITLKKE